MPVLDIDGNGTALFSSDGILILRYMNGYRGNDLINGLLAPGATRTTPEAVEGYILDIWELLDVDGNHQVEKNDGLMILFSLAGLNGDNLTQFGKLVELGGSRTTPEAIKAYIDKLRFQGMTY